MSHSEDGTLYSNDFEEDPKQKRTPTPRSEPKERPKQAGANSQRRPGGASKTTAKQQSAQKGSKDKKQDESWKRYQPNVQQMLALEKLRVAQNRREKTTLEIAIKECDQAGLNDDDRVMAAEEDLKCIETARELKSACNKKDAQRIRKGIHDIRDAGLEEKMSYEVRQAVYVLKKNDIKKAKIRPRLTLDRQTICEIRMIQRPPESLHNVMKAVLLLFGHDENLTKSWATVQRLLNPSDNHGIYRRLLSFDETTVHPRFAARSKQILDAIDFEKLRSTSGGAASFFIWAMGVIGENDADPADAKQQLVILSEEKKKLEEQKRSELEKRKKDEKSQKQNAKAPKTTNDTKH